MIRWFVILLVSPFIHPSKSFQGNTTTMKRVEFITVALGVIMSCAGEPVPFGRQSAFAFSGTSKGIGKIITSNAGLPIVGYQEIQLDMRLSNDLNVNVPVACWFPLMGEDQTTQSDSYLNDASYAHRISVKKIGSMLAGMNFIPEFVSKEFQLKPTTPNVKVVCQTVKSWNAFNGRSVIILAHGFLGSRFDMAHLAEDLASNGYVIFSPEFPESLASSYEKVEGLDRGNISSNLLNYISSNIEVNKFGIIGHSLGCGTALTTGDDSWTRVCIAGPSVRRDGVRINGNQLAIVSTNDGLVKSIERVNEMIPKEFVRIPEDASSGTNFASKTALIFDRKDGPNHISFLAGNVNDSMVDFLSPLLPVAKALNIPVLDFDKYQESRDSQAVAEIVIPTIRSYLKQFL